MTFVYQVICVNLVIVWVCLSPVRAASSTEGLPPIDAFFQPLEKQTRSDFQHLEQFPEAANAGLSTSASAQCSCAVTQRQDAEVTKSDFFSLNEAASSSLNETASSSLIASQTLVSPLGRREKTFTDSDMLRLAAALRARGDRPISRSYVS